MSVYFVRRKADPAGPIKIGFTRKIESRLAQLNAAYEGGVDLLACCDGGAQLEGSLHRRLEEYRLDGEWFQPAPPVLEAMHEAKANLIGGSDPLTRDRVLPEDEMSADIRVETRFYLNELMKREWRGYGDSIEGARDRVLDRVGVHRSQGKLLFHKLRRVKNISADVYRLLSLAYCDALYAEGKAEERHLNIIRVTHGINERMRRAGEMPQDGGYFAPWAVDNRQTDRRDVAKEARP